MITYQDLQAAGSEEKNRVQFIQSTIAAHKGSRAYGEAMEAAAYYDGENPTINRYEKLLYDLEGRAHQDMYTANHKLASHFFGFAVDQQISYLLGNGVTFRQEQNKKRLGKGFDQQIMEAGKKALIAGVSYGFWNMDHLQIFELTEFVPLYDEESGALAAGIRFWQLDAGKPLHATLYEPDGYTDYMEEKGKPMAAAHPKRAYRQIVKTSKMDGAQVVGGENYAGLPIIPLRNGEKAWPLLHGKRNTIDALELASSNMVNNVDEGNLIYWVLTNCGGMDDLDDVKFIERLKTMHVAHADGDDGATAVPHTIEAPYAGTEATIDMLKRKLYEDFQAFDAAAVTAGNQTATAIKASYVPLDLKTDKFEAEVTHFIHGILALAEIDDEPTYTRNQIINKTEETQTVLLGAPYYDDEYITKKLLTILGDGDQAEELLRRRAAEEINRTAPPEVAVYE